MELLRLDGEFTVCKLAGTEGVDLSRPFTFLSVTDDEISLVCETGRLPANATETEHGWRALKIAGVLDFGMVGVIAKISAILAENGISLFVVSTFNTDYVLLKADKFERATGLLAAAGYTVV